MGPYVRPDWSKSHVLSQCECTPTENTKPKITVM